MLESCCSMSFTVFQKVKYPLNVLITWISVSSVVMLKTRHTYIRVEIIPLIATTTTWKGTFNIFYLHWDMSLSILKLKGFGSFPTNRCYKHALPRIFEIEPTSRYVTYFEWDIALIILKVQQLGILAWYQRDFRKLLYIFVLW